MKNDMKMIIHIDLGDDFIGTVLDAMEEEFEISCKKWGVRLNQEDKENIFQHSIIQLKRKTSDNIRNTWDLSDSLVVKVNSHKRPIEISLPAPEAESSRIKLFHTRDGWEIDQETIEDTVRLADFAEHIKSKIKTWARTAVFYGVGSYAG